MDIDKLILKGCVRDKWDILGHKPSCSKKMLWNRERRQDDQWENGFNYAGMKWCESRPEWGSESDSKLFCSFSKGKKGTTALKKIALAGVPYNGIYPI